MQSSGSKVLGGCGMMLLKLSSTGKNNLSFSLYAMGSAKEINLFLSFFLSFFSFEGLERWKDA